jgi:AcrR family transcriptional regulator
MNEAKLLNLPDKRRPRRSQLERTAETRARILAATVESIGDVGFQRTTSAEITRRSGVTWGAVQHHFGSKDGILAAILEDSFNRFSEGLMEAFANLGGSASLGRRIDAFIESAWAHFDSAHYRAAFEILLKDSAARRSGSTSDPKSDPNDLSWQGEILKAWTRIWRRLFPDVDLGRRRAMMIQHYTISVLSGLASMQFLAGEAAPFVRDELDLLKRTLAREFRAARASAKVTS